VCSLLFALFFFRKGIYWFRVLPRLPFQVSSLPPFGQTKIFRFVRFFSGLCRWMRPPVQPFHGSKCVFAFEVRTFARFLTSCTVRAGLSQSIFFLLPRVLEREPDFFLCPRRVTFWIKAPQAGTELSGQEREVPLPLPALS